MYVYIYLYYYYILYPCRRGKKSTVLTYFWPDLRQITFYNIPVLVALDFETK